MARVGYVQLYGAGSCALVSLTRQALRDLERTEESLNQLEWMLDDLPPVLKPLVHRGFRARMGIGLRELQEHLEGVHAVLRDLDRACLGQDEETFLDNAQALLDLHESTARILNMFLTNLADLPREVRETTADEDANRGAEEIVDKHADAVATLLTTLDMVRSTLKKQTGLTSSG